MIATDTVLTLRDLRGEHPAEVRRIAWGTRWPDSSFLYVGALLELSGVALQWRKDDRLPVPEGHPAQRDDAVVALVKKIAEVIAKEERASLYGADCSLITSWEPT